ncbi:GNAT family N-acetyltransferase [Roseivirga sp. UBA838]|uniref:GNAT family N-acetyltransferase n=1 Tax=Roseivirga sp. UBA838 TaxID=1947393 RepID=UPI00257A7239|nr:GNAT family N-acetyltransferase [Roseivirga sp. UBA838]|tara:strand:+ start:12461 stop:12898 length:438 start_codon:yes stop_codon:yes gene_type:complete
MIEIIEGSLPDALQVLGKLPEFDPLLSTEHYLERVKNKQQLTLLAKVNGELAGCKVAYDRDNDGMLYSWLGGVAPQHRKKGLARRMADYQESWALKNGYRGIRFKTLNRHKAMLTFAINNGFQISQVKPKDELENYRITLIKHLL